MPPRRPSVFGARAFALLSVLFFGSLRPMPLDGQAIPAILGTAGGLAAGAYVTTGVYVAKARAGRFIYSVDDVLSVGPEALPVLLLPLSAGILGAVDGDRLGAAAIGAGLGFVSGAALGTGLGQLIWGQSEGRWSGAVIGSAAGLVIGGVIGALAHTDDSNGPTQPALRLSARIPLSWRIG